MQKCSIKKSNCIEFWVCFCIYQILIGWYCCFFQMPNDLHILPVMGFVRAFCIRYFRTYLILNAVFHRILLLVIDIFHCYSVDKVELSMFLPTLSILYDVFADSKVRIVCCCCLEIYLQTVGFLFCIFIILSFDCHQLPHSEFLNIFYTSPCRRN